MQNLFVGGGVVVPTISGAHAAIGGNSVQLLNNSGKLSKSTPEGQVSSQKL